jgi:hypothetical protein
LVGRLKAIKEKSERFTQVGPGTPMGTLLRRYWHPITASVELDAELKLSDVPCHS